MVYNVYLVWGTKHLLASEGHATKTEAVTAANAWRSSFSVSGWPIEIKYEDSGEDYKDADGEDDDVPDTLPSSVHNI